MTYEILSVKSKDKKSTLVQIELLRENERKKYVVSEGTYREIGCPLSGEEIDEDSIAALAEEDERRRALLKALNILSYADNNERTLKRKLITAGFSIAAAESALRECVSLGYVNEEKQLEHLILKYNRELYGPKKIVAKLSSRSYLAKDVIKVIRSLEEAGEIDFAKSKQSLIKTKLPENATYEERMKLLYKYGYIK